LAHQATSAHAVATSGTALSPQHLVVLKRLADAQRDGDRVLSVEVLRDAPCGSARFVASVLPGVRVQEAAERGALRHHHHPCLASMEIVPDLNDTLMHLSGYIVRAAIRAGLKEKEQPPCAAGIPETDPSRPHR